MRIIKIGLCLVFLGLGTNIFAQDDAYRNQNWQPKKGKYYFSSVITWQYNKHTENENTQSSIAVYLDSLSNTFLITPQSYGLGEEMIEFILIEKNGRVFVAYADDSGKHLKKYQFKKDSVDLSSIAFYDKTDRKISLKQTPLPQKQVFIYQKQQNSPQQIEEFAMVNSNIDFSLLKWLNLLNLENPIPTILIQNPIIKNKDLPVYVCTKNEQLVLLDWLPSEYFVDLNLFKNQ